MENILGRVYQHWAEAYARAVDSLAALAELLAKRSAPPNLSVLGRRFAEIITKHDKTGTHAKSSRTSARLFEPSYSFVVPITTLFAEFMLSANIFRKAAATAPPPLAPCISAISPCCS